MKIITALLAGLLFGIGLLLSGMTNPAKVQNFLDLFGQWDPSLAFVIGGAIAVAAPGYYFLRKRPGTVFGEAFQWPTRNDLDTKLIVGGAMFGVGWGIGGFCPGPALVSLPFVFSGISGALWFLPAMLLGLAIAKRING